MTKVFLDGGTHLGQGLRKLAGVNQVDATWHVHTWEANPYTHAEFEKTLPHPIYNIQSYNQALSDHDGEIVLNIETARLKHHTQESPMGQGTSILDMAVWGDVVSSIGRFDTTVTVNCIDFAAWIKQHYCAEDYIVLKLDIEGAEYQVLQHMLDSGVLSWIDQLYVEWHAHMTGNPTLLQQEEFLRGAIADLKISMVDWH